ncbi:MAG: HAD hydrolase-like protein [Actinomycetes bacterium]
MTQFAHLVIGFDLDMTLIDSRPGVAHTFEALNRLLGTSIPGDQLSEQLGPTLETVLADYFPPEEIEGVCDQFRSIYADLGPKGSSLLPGALEAFEAVEAAGGKNLVITAKFEPNAHRCLDAVGLRAAHVVGWRHGPAKADALIEHSALAYVGDTPPDMHAALVAGITAMGVATGPWSANELMGEGANFVMASLLEFPERLNALLSS